MVAHTILFMAANPTGTASRDLGDEARAIEAELARGDHRDSFKFETRWAAQPLDVIRESRKLKPTIVHFAGHTPASAHASPLEDPQRSQQAQSVDASNQGLCFQGADGRIRVVQAAAIAEAFSAAAPSVKLVVLSACYSEQQTEALLGHVDCVVGMSGDLTDDAARAFACMFYGGLAGGDPVGRAFKQGCAAIGLEGLSGGKVPQLRVRRGVDAERLVLTGQVEASIEPAPRSSIMPLSARRLEPRPGEATVDLGTAWGLKRGRILGLVAGFHNAPVFDTLVAVETLVQEVAPAELALPPRRWVEIPFTDPPPAPADVAALKAQLARRDPSLRGTWMSRNDAPPGTSVGLVLKAAVKSNEQWASERQRAPVVSALCAWMRRLALFAAAGHAVDAVVEVQAHTRAATVDVVQQLDDELARTMPWRAEAVRLQLAPQDEVPTEGRRASGLAAWGVRAKSRTAEGGELECWLSCAVEALIKETPEAVNHDLVVRHRKVEQLIQRLNLPDPTTSPGSAGSALTQLDGLAPDDGELDAQLLSFMDIAMPGRTSELLRAYGSGARPAGQRSALRFAARSPTYVDAYVDGALAAQRFPTRNELIAASGDGGAFAAEILRGLLRRHSDPSAVQHVKALGPFIRMLGLGPADARVIELAPELDLAAPDPAAIWKLLAEPITRDRLAAVVRTSDEVRAAFGLVNAATWRALAGDAHRRRRILELRGDWALDFELAGGLGRQVRS